MNDQERIQFVLREALAGAGGMLAVRTLYSMMGAWLAQQGGQVTIADAQTYSRNIIRAALIIHANPQHWTKAGAVSPRFDQVAFAGNFFSSDDKYTAIYVTISNVIMQLDTAYQDRFDIQSALHFLEQLQEMTEVFQRELKAKE